MTKDFIMLLINTLLEQIKTSDNFQKLEDIKQQAQNKTTEYTAIKTKINNLENAIIELNEEQKADINIDMSLEELDVISRKNASIDTKIKLINELISKNNTVLENIINELEKINRDKNTIAKSLYNEMLELCKKEISMMDTKLFSLLDYLRLMLNYQGLLDLNREVKYERLSDEERKEIKDCICDITY